jgi:flagellin-like hook-associated protein FlgL
MNQINQNLESEANEKINTTEEISKIEDVDAVKAFTDLTRDQNVLRAAISVTDKVLKDNPSDILFNR